MVLICLSSRVARQSLSMPFCLSLSLCLYSFFSSFPLPLSPSPPLFILPSLFHLPPASLSLTLTLCIASADLYALCLCTDLHPLRCLSLSFCILNCPYSASFPFLALQLISSRPLLYLIFHFLPASQSRRVPPALALPLLFFFPSSSSSGLSISPGLAPPSPSPSLWAILLCSRCSVRRKYSLFAPPP